MKRFHNRQPEFINIIYRIKTLPLKKRYYIISDILLFFIIILFAAPL